jgi:amino acid adenylation domain-containing protein
MTGVGRTTLVELIDDASTRHAERIAVEEADGTALHYRELSALADQVCHALIGAGVRPGDRVGLCLPKSADAVAAIWGILRAGAAYVPVDPATPLDRTAYTFGDCAVRAVVVEEGQAAELYGALTMTGATPAFLTLPAVGGGQGVASLPRTPTTPRPTPPGPDDLAYILYTSGSTGRPKGVTLTHQNAMSFAHWCVETFEPRAEDRFSSHAPLHFDLSILDLYTPLSAGARVVLIPADVGREPRRLAELMASRSLTVWYSTPSILAMLVQFGHLERYDLSSLRLVLFAGEVFPVAHLRRLTELLPGPRYCNLYGPTETNVCTWYEVRLPVPAGRTVPYPIGRVCRHLSARVVDADGRDVPGSAEGELCIAGPSVMRQYWNLPEATAAAFLRDASDTAWYRTGDIVCADADGDFVFLGRRDRMVKRRGYRIELGDIEAGLYRHPEVREAAVVALPEAGGGVRIRAYLTWRGTERASVIMLKRFCTEVLPAYMTPDEFVIRDALPKTPTDKIDYRRLAAEEAEWISR